MDDRTKPLIALLEDTLALELSLAQTLAAHQPMTHDEQHRAVLEDHRQVTIEQAKALRDRLDELGASKSPVQVARTAAVSLMSGSFQLAKAPYDLLTRPKATDRAIRNARDEAASEAAEIAAYDAIEAMAIEVDDVRTADLARRHREQEEQMLGTLREDIIPQLARQPLLSSV
jgi:ferritin-like metal-binding protein YciE